MTHLLMGFVLNILPVHLHHPVPWPQPGHVSRGAGLHFADERSAFIPQVKPIALYFGQETEPRSQLTLHPSQSIGESRSMRLRRINRCFLQERWKVSGS